MTGLSLADVIAEGKNTTKSLARVDKWGSLQADLTHRNAGDR